MMRCLVLFGLVAMSLFGQDGASIYKKHCAQCHDNPTGRVPPFSALRAMSPPAIMQALQNGPMKPQAAGLTTAELYALVTYLATPAAAPAAAPPASAFCSQRGESPGDHEIPSWMGWGADLANSRFLDARQAGITAADVPKLKLKWAFGLGDGTSVHSQAAAGLGHVFVANLTGEVDSLDARTGCIQWTFTADAPVRSAVVLGVSSPKPSAVFFGDQKANAYALDATTGKLRWKVHVADHFAALITGAPVLHGDVLYVPVSSYEEILAGSPGYKCCSFRGSLVALDASTGKEIWKAYTIAEEAHASTDTTTGKPMLGPSGAAIWGSPTFDEKRSALYVATGDNYSDPPSATSDAVLAFDSTTGKLLWSKQVTSDDVYNVGPDAKGRDFDFGQPPILVSLPGGQRALVIGQKSGMVHALDPDHHGQILWQTRAAKGGALGGIEWGSAADRENMYVAVSDQGMAGVPDKTVARGYRLELDPTSGGGLLALRLTDGEKMWSAAPPTCGDRKQCSPAQSAAVSAISGVVFSGSVDGHLRAYSTSTGQVIWDVDTERSYDTTNGPKAHGGSIDCVGPVISNGMLYVDSGYGQWGGVPGNVFLAFSVDGK
ncbi:MAG: PQQ-binding-like beta-propeller repeat protein [Bryobacteraceae bacterium]